MGFEGFPIAVGWELTLACNLRCRHCGSTAGPPRARELTTDEALAICDQLPELLVGEVDFTGGEPLLHPGWERIARRLGELDIRTKLITNGALLQPETARRLKSAGVVRVGVSLDGLAGTHDALRERPGLFGQALLGIQALRENGIPATVITTVTDQNVPELPALQETLRTVGVDVWQVQPLFPLGRAKECAEVTLSEEAYLRLGRFVREWLPQPAARPAILPGDSFGYFTDLDQRRPPWSGCSAGLVLCGITSDGNVKGCLSMPDALVEGNLRERTLWDIWFDPAAFAYNRKFVLEDLGASCRGCTYGEACRGGCSSMSFGCTGHLHDDPYCFETLSRTPASTQAPPR